MIETVAGLIEAVREHMGLIIAVVFVAAALEAVFGLGVIVPGETALVLAGVALGPEPILAVAALAGAAGAFTGDHVGFLVGRKVGPRLAQSRMVRRLGEEKWHRATALMQRRGFWVIVTARLLPGVRTLVAAAAGASPMRYARFVVAAVIASVLWACLWLLGGALVGSAFSHAMDSVALPLLVGVVVVVGLALVVRRMRRRSQQA